MWRFVQLPEQTEILLNETLVEILSFPQGAERWPPAQPETSDSPS